MSLFSQPKIIYPDISRGMTFVVDRMGYYVSNTAYFLTTKNEDEMAWICSVLSSPLMKWYYRLLSVQLGEQAVRMFSIYITRLPIAAQRQTTIEDAYHLTQPERLFVDSVKKEK